MSEDSKTFEKKLDLDFLYYLSLTKNLYGNLTDEAHKQFCEIWLAYLFGKTCNSLPEKCDRNVFISRLLLQMQSGRLNTNFLEPPPNGPLPCAFTAFGLPTEVEGLKGFEDMGYQIDSSVGAGSGDFSESSRDGRTYLATRHLPQGVMAFLAVTNNEGEPAWIPQTCPASLSQEASNKKKGPGYNMTRKVLRSTTNVPLSKFRRSPEERAKVLEWMDKIISDCNKWLQGEDPHNMELEQMFQTLYEEYKKDPENSELLKHPRTVRNMLFRDIRNHMFERRAEVSKRELILDELETSQYTEKFRANTLPQSPVFFSGVCRRFNPSILPALGAIYPEEVVNRFTILASIERARINAEVERRTKEKIENLRKTILDDSKQELQKLKKAQEDYKEYYAIFKDVQKQLIDLEKEHSEICQSSANQADQRTTNRCRQDRELEIQQAKRDLEREVKNMYEMRLRVDKIKESCNHISQEMLKEGKKVNCQRLQVYIKTKELAHDIKNMRKKKEELICKIQKRFKN